VLITVGSESGEPALSQELDESQRAAWNFNPWFANTVGNSFDESVIALLLKLNSSMGRKSSLRAVREVADAQARFAFLDRVAKRKRSGINDLPHYAAVRSPRKAGPAGDLVKVRYFRPIVDIGKQVPHLLAREAGFNVVYESLTHVHPHCSCCFASAGMSVAREHGIPHFSRCVNAVAISASNKAIVINGQLVVCDCAHRKNTHDRSNGQQ